MPETINASSNPPITANLSSQDDDSSIITAHEQLWRRNGEVMFDVMTKYQQKAHLLWPDDVSHISSRKVLDYFELMFPLEIVSDALTHTNGELARRGKPEDFTVQDFWTYLGIRLAITVVGGNKPIPEYWRDKEESHIFDPAYDFGSRFNMRRHRFEEISSCLRFASFDTGVLDEVCVYLPCVCINNFIFT